QSLSVRRRHVRPGASGKTDTSEQAQPLSRFQTVGTRMPRRRDILLRQSNLDRVRHGATLLAGGPARRRLLLATGVVLAAMLLLGVPSAPPVSQPGEPPGVDPGTPPWTGAANPMPAEPAGFDPTTSTLQSIFDADVAAGGTSYWFDRIL